MRTFQILTLAAVLAGCATTATSSQMQNLKTEASQVPMGFANSALEDGACVELSKHELQGKVGVTLGHDLGLLADEIDDVVSFNGGNAYMIHDWEWVVVGGLGSTAPLVEITVLTCGESPSTVDSQEGIIATQEAELNEFSEIDICRDFSLIASMVMDARQKKLPMSETLPFAMTQIAHWAKDYGFDLESADIKEAASIIVLPAYDEFVWPSDSLYDEKRQDAIDEFENRHFEECYNGLTSD